MAATSSNYNAGYNSGTISQVNNYNPNIANYVEIQVGASDPALKELYTHIAAGAMHNSAARRDAPKCHPETRKAVQENIFGWISHREEEGEPPQLLWLTGPAGTGKTAIMGTISETLEKSGQLAASFYFASYTGLIETTSKDRFVTTLAYQLQRHDSLKEQISRSMLSTLQADPALIKTNLKTQMEELVLRPLRNSSTPRRSRNAAPPLVILVDGVDECGEGVNRSNENDQIEVLYALLQALLDPAFPCKIIVASRPENWIRRFFTEAAAGHFTEIFLDNKFNPDKDIDLFLKSKFAELSRQYNFAPSSWPRQEDIQTLVSNASGQFIYPATVIRFIDSHGQPPKKQLEVVLSATPPKDRASPFAVLDALYIAVLNSSPSPSETVLWLKAHQRLVADPSPSVWTINYLFESCEGQAQLLFGLPSLVFTQSYSAADSSWYGNRLAVPLSSIPNPSWCSTYSFYHKSFLDFLDSPERSGAAFPDVANERVVQWIWMKRSYPLFVSASWKSWGMSIGEEAGIYRYCGKKYFPSAIPLLGIRDAQLLCCKCVIFCKPCSSWFIPIAARIARVSRDVNDGERRFWNRRAAYSLDGLGKSFCLTDSASSALKVTSQLLVRPGDPSAIDIMGRPPWRVGVARYRWGRSAGKERRCWWLFNMACGT
ncbi:hypothetical protein NMY22_g12309 [Coprinellus aureogranulatus]|nr:hypothetical protein NMY22_g12309 [Coprinellus aureogranulatus]